MQRPVWLTDSEQCVWRAFLEVNQRLYDQLDRELMREVGLPLAYYQILAMLSEAPLRTLRMSELADKTWSSRSRLSHAVDRLEEKGWVMRHSCDSDKRGAYATLTDAGFDVLSAAAPSHVASVRRRVFDNLRPAQVDELGAALRAIATHLAELERSSSPA